MRLEMLRMSLVKVHFELFRKRFNMQNENLNMKLNSGFDEETIAQKCHVSININSL